MRSKISRTLGVLCVGSALFMFEITLTRLFSALMAYHFVFIAIALAMLGWTIGGVYSFKWLSALKKRTDEYIRLRKVHVLLSMASALLIAVLFLYEVPYNDVLIILYITLSTIPFILGGYYMSLVFTEGAKNSSFLYFADLLGSALGSLLIVVLLNNFSLLRIGLILSLLILLVYAFNLPDYRRIALGSALAVALLVGVIAGGNFLDDWAKNFGAYKGNPKMLASFATKPNIVYTLWNSLARTDVIENAGNKDKTVLIDGAASSDMVKFNGDLASINYLRQNVGFFPFGYRSNKSALLIGPGGGKDILFARLAGIQDITAVELNPGSVAAVRHYKDFNGNVYDLPGTKTYIQDGRSFITKDSSKYDVIFLSKVMTQSSETLGYALSENYIYTKEAYKSYLDHLNPEGTLAFVLHGVNDLGKATSTLLTIFEERGIPQDKAIQYMAVVNSSFEDGQQHNHAAPTIMYPLLMVKNSPFTKEDSDNVMMLSIAGNQTIISLPGIHEQLKAIAPTADRQSSYLVTDDYPFFYNVGKKAPSVIYLILLGIFSAGLVLLKSAFDIKDQSVRFFRNYFAYIGLAFMLVEVPLVQKLVLLFGHPTLTFSTVIAILLFSAGIGSLFSKFITRYLPLKAAGTLIFIYTGILFIYLPKFITAFQGSVLSVKILATLSLILPLGVLMGLPFPTGIRLLEVQKKDNFIPLMWGINGWMSVIGSVLSLVLAMSFGFNATLMTGALIYLVFAFHTRQLPYNTQGKR